MKHVLWLSNWYPNRRDAFTGDFIERHAMATSGFANITVLHVLKDDLMAHNKVEVHKTSQDNLTIYKAYYGTKCKFKWLEQLLSLNKYFEVQKQIYRLIATEIGRPEIVHVNVAMKAGMLAIYLKRKYNIPFVVTEHWTGYHPSSSASVHKENILYQFINKRILKNAALFLPVSKNLGETVCNHFIKIPYQVIPNVVNTELFFYTPFTPKKFRFIHPSQMNHAKNPEGILQACALVKNRGYAFELIMVGNDDQRLIAMANALGLFNKEVFFKPPIAYANVSQEMQQSSALLLFSRIENLPCVILEALCCGLPVVSSNVGGIKEVVHAENGLLVESENITALAQAMITMMENYERYDRVSIAQNASALFNYNNVGKSYAAVYASMLG